MTQVSGLQEKDQIQPLPGHRELVVMKNVINGLKKYTYL